MKYFIPYTTQPTRVKLIPANRWALRLLGSLRINPWNNSALCATFQRALDMARETQVLAQKVVSHSAFFVETDFIGKMMKNSWTNNLCIWMFVWNSSCSDSNDFCSNALSLSNNSNIYFQLDGLTSSCLVLPLRVKMSEKIASSSGSPGMAWPRMLMQQLKCSPPS